MLRIALKNQCPRCGTGRVARRERKGWMRLIPGSCFWVCRVCRQNFLVLRGERKALEHRRYPRIRISKEMVARLGSGGRDLGPVREISRSGLSFFYVADRDPPSGSFQLDVACKQKRMALRNIDVTTVSDTRTDQLAPYSNISVRCRGLRFDHLSWRQWLRLRWIAFRCNCA